MPPPTLSSFYKLPPSLRNLNWSIRLPIRARRHASSKPPPSNEKAIVLPQPDKFRPPSHPSRLNSSKRTTTMPRNYPGPTAHPDEIAARKTRTYPHMFPNKGTFMHWFLMNRTLHMFITLGTLATLAIVTLTQRFLYYSPFGHLVAPLSTLPLHPFAYIYSWFKAIDMNELYMTERVQERQMRRLEDTQKRRLYRRAHGLEDLENSYGGIDVRGLVPWDDGELWYHRKEREDAERNERKKIRRGRREKEERERRQGGRAADEIEGQEVVVKEVERRGDRERSEAVWDGMGGWMGVRARDKPGQEVGGDVKGFEGVVDRPTVEPVEGQATEGEPRRKRRPVKKWLGIWE